MKALLHARIACLASILCSAIFVIVELLAHAYVYAAVQTALLAAGCVLYAVLARVMATTRTSLPPPASPSGHSSRER